MKNSKKQKDMSIDDMVYRTKTYLAGDWTGDSDLINKLKEWNINQRLQLHFVNVHEVTQSSDSSLNCSIKRSLRKRLNISKTFVLIVGEKTLSLKSGACYLCRYYNRSSLWYSTNPYCTNGGYVDNRNYVQYECEMALKDYTDGKLKNIVVIYNGLLFPDYSRCPNILRNVGTHIGSDVIENGVRKWAYSRIKDVICK